MIVLLPDFIKLEVKTSVKLKLFNTDETDITISLSNNNISYKIYEDHLIIKALQGGNTIITINDLYSFTVYIKDTLAYEPDIDYIRTTFPYFDYNSIPEEYLRELIKNNTLMIKEYIDTAGLIEPDYNNKGAIFPIKQYISLFVAENLSLQQVVNSDIINYIREQKEKIWDLLQLSLAKRSNNNYNQGKLQGKVLKP